MAFVELRVIGYALILMFALNLMVGLVVNEDMVDGYDQDEAINDITDELDAVSGFITGALLGLGTFIFGLFGVDFILYITVLPAWMLGALTLYNSIVVFVVVFYLVERIWVG